MGLLALSSIHPSICMEQFGTHWKEVLETSYLIVLKKKNLWRKFKFHPFIHLFSIDLLQDMEIVIFIIIQEKTKQILIRVAGTLHADIFIFTINSCLIFLRMRNYSNKFVEKIKTHFLCSVTSSPTKITPFMR
jgi:hypothetical protein